MHTQTVVIVGRPNVGKSTLFNRLVGKRYALVYDKPGVTRDVKTHKAELGALSFQLMDTPGLFDPSDESQPTFLSQGMRDQALGALKDVSLILCVLDGQQGCTPYDKEITLLLRKLHTPIIVVVNKCESHKHEPHLIDAMRLGFDHVIAVSAEHGLGFSDLEEAMSLYISEDNDETEDNHDNKPLRLAIMGRPNVGKSTLVNTLMGAEKQLTGDYPGLTRDAIEFSTTYEGRLITLVDTAGIKRKTHDALDKLALYDAKRTMDYAHVVVLMIDATSPELLEKQDLSLANDILNEGRALIIALNKWDKIKNPDQTLTHVKEQLKIHLAQVSGIVCIPLCALTVKQINSLWRAVIHSESLWNSRIQTGPLNQWLNQATQMHAPPMVNGRRIRCKYITQIKSRPPTFRLFCSKATDLPPSYVRYLTNSLRKQFDLTGIPIRFQCVSSKNPYAS